MAKNETAVAITEATPEQIAEVIRGQVAVIGEIELRGNFEKLKLGAMVSEAVRILRLEGAAGRGVGHAGDGALGWWGEVCPKREDGSPVIPYKTVVRWRQAAENLPTLMGVGVMKREEVVALLANDPAEAVGERAELLSSAERLANGMSMRQLLLWGGDESAKKVGRPKGAAKFEFKKDPPEVEAARIWAEIKNSLECATLRDSIEVLEPRIAVIMVGVLKDLEKRLAKRANG